MTGFYRPSQRDEQRMRRFMSISGAGIAAPVSGLWSPLSLTVPPAILLDHLSTMTNNGTTVSAWSDRSGNARNAASVGAPNPFYNAADLNGYPALRADGGTTGGSGGQYLQPGGTGTGSLYASASQGWLFAVYKLDGTSSTQFRAAAYAETGTLGLARFGLFTDGSTGAGKPSMRVRRLDADSAAALVGPTALNDGNYHMVLAWMNWGTREGRLYVDGNSPTTNTALTTAGSTSSTSSNVIAVVGGVSNVTTINGREVAALFGTTLPSDVEVDKIFGYYANQLGLTGNLPVGHPYKSSPP